MNTNTLSSRLHQGLLLVFGAAMLILFFQGSASAQEKNRIVRIAKIKVDSTQLERYNALLKEGIETAVRVEPGVLMLYAVYDKSEPATVTVFEIYADADAYQAHLQTAHFKKYKTGTMQMVKSFQLIDVVPIALAARETLIR